VFMDVASPAKGSEGHLLGPLPGGTPPSVPHLAFSHLPVPYQAVPHSAFSHLPGPLPGGTPPSVPHSAWIHATTCDQERISSKSASLSLSISVCEVRGAGGKD
jgi:hypothetical protein